jgi:hypothetical protein
MCVDASIEFSSSHLWQADNAMKKKGWSEFGDSVIPNSDRETKNCAHCATPAILERVDALLECREHGA